MWRRSTWIEYFEQIQVLAESVLALISESLNLPSDTLVKSMRGPTSGSPYLANRVNYYPPRKATDDPLGVPSHSDPVAITFLLADDVAGLEVNKDDKWVEVEPIQNAFIINIGDQLEVRSPHPSLFDFLVRRVHSSYGPNLSRKIHEISSFAWFSSDAWQVLTLRTTNTVSKLVIVSALVLIKTYRNSKLILEKNKGPRSVYCEIRDFYVRCSAFEAEIKRWSLFSAFASRFKLLCFRMLLPCLRCVSVLDSSFDSCLLMFAINLWPSCRLRGLCRFSPMASLQV